MSVIGTYRRRREAVYRTLRRQSAGGWKADAFHPLVSVVLMAAVVAMRIWWAAHAGWQEEALSCDSASSCHR